ncbi:MAG TPA: hypothetical protein VN661_00550 [Candidatus Acidoferrales bacterium]|nr:hypothetical protein [Candidatus Acidoferrales bacterium]
MKPHRLFIQAVLIICAALLPATLVHAQGRQQQGKSIGKVSVMGNLIVMDLNQGALGRQNLFDLGHRTLRFTPDGDGYRVSNLPLQWDADFGPELSGSRVAMHNFQFPFSGKTWDAFTVGVTGSIRFVSGEEPAAPAPGQGQGAARNGRRGPGGFQQGGVSIARFDALGEAAGNLVNTVPAICVFFKPRMSGARYAKELNDREVVTWDVTEPWGNIQDFTWKKTVNKFQLVLHKDGVIEMSYDQLAAKDAIVGVYPLLSGGAEKDVATLQAKPGSSAAPNLDIKDVKLSVVDGIFLKATFETAGPVAAEGDQAIAGVTYRVHFNASKPSLQSPSRSAAAAASPAEAVWTIRGFAPRNRNFGGGARYVASGPGLSRTAVKVSGSTISVQGILPPDLHGATHISVSADSSAAGSEAPVSQVPSQPVALEGIHSPAVHFSSLKPNAGPYPVVYESFHYYNLPDSRDLACTVIKSLGDKFDFLVYYSDFRVDNQEAGTPSEGPRGSSNGLPVTGMGDRQPSLASYCSAGRFQWGFIQPVYAGAIQMQEYPPPDAPMGDTHDITFYQKQLAEISQDGKMPPYMYAMSQIGHELGHRWSAFVSAKVGNETIPLGPTHWARGLQAVVPFPYVRPSEASIMGGGVWQDNFDGTFTQLDDDYYVPATGYSYLDLYLMGLISPKEVPDFFILRNIVPQGRDANGHLIVKAERTKVTIQDVIAAEGPRTPDVDHSQRKFNTGMVLVVQHGKKPTPKLIQEVTGIRAQWLKFFPIATGRRASVTANPR